MSDDPSRTNQQAEGDHIAQADRGSTAIIGDDNIVVNDDGIAQVVKVEGAVSNVTQIGKVVVQFVNEKVFKQFGLEQRVGFVLLAILIIGVGIGGPFFVYQALRPRPPERMIGDFRIAVAGFAETENARDSEIGLELAQGVYLGIEKTFEEINLDFTVTMWGPERVGTIKGQGRDERAVSAEQIAETIDADIVVYGFVDATDNAWQVFPEFYVSLENFYEAQEVVGQYEIGEPIPVLGQGSVADRIELSGELTSRAEVLSYLAVGLSYYAARNFERALSYFQTSEIVPGWDDSEGKEVVYLLAGNAAGKNDDLEVAEQYYTRAQVTNPDYARVYAGLGNVRYIQAVDAFTESITETALMRLDESVYYYQQALFAPVQPAQSDIDAKAHSGLGRSYLLRAIILDGDMLQAAREFEWVITDYNQSQAKRLRERAANAHASLGLIYRLNAEDTLSIAEYKQAIALIEDIPQLREQAASYYAAIADEYVDADRPSDAIVAYQKAIELAVSAEAIAIYQDKLDRVQSQ